MRPSCCHCHADAYEQHNADRITYHVTAEACAIIAISSMPAVTRRTRRMIRRGLRSVISDWTRRACRLRSIISGWTGRACGLRSVISDWTGRACRLRSVIISYRTSTLVLHVCHKLSERCHIRTIKLSRHTSEVLACQHYVTVIVM